MTEPPNKDTDMLWPPRPGKTLANGRFLLLDKLGEGHFGEVWAALEQETERSVAIKLLHPDVAEDDDHLAGFEQEAHAMARLDHPGLVRLVDYNPEPWPGGVRFLTMEMLDGRPMRLGGHSIEQVLRLMARALEVLAYIHARGLVHGALTPDNILILNHGGWENEGYPLKITGLGIARPGETLAARLRARPLEGKTARPMASIAWMSPEQARGDHASVGPASDIYSLGAMLYEIVCGRPPFEGSPWGVALSHDRDPIPEPTMPEVSMVDFAPLASLLSDMLRKQYQLRPQSACGLQRRIETLLKTLPASVLAAQTPVREDIDTVNEGTQLQISAWTEEDSLQTAQGVPAWQDKRHARTFIHATTEVTDIGDPEEPWALRFSKELPPIGRETHSAQLDALFSEVASGGEATGVVLTGEPGAGKRHLARWLVERVMEHGQARVLHIDLTARGDLVSAFRLALYRHLRLPDMERGPLAERIDEVLAFSNPQDTERLVHFLYDPISAPSTQTQQIAFPAEWRLVWSTAVKQIVRHPDPAPLLVWIDGGLKSVWRDVAAWAEALLQMARSRHLPIIFVWSSYQTEIDPVALDAIMEDRRAFEIQLGPLPEKDLRKLALLLEPELSEPTLVALVERLGGNPRLLLEALQSWRESELLRRGRGKIEVSPHTVAQLATDMNQALRLRLSAFLGQCQHPENTERAFKLMAMLGPTFSRRQAAWSLEGTGVSPERLAHERWLKSRHLSRAPRLGFADEALRTIILDNARGRGELKGLMPACVELHLRGALDAMIAHDWDTARADLNAALSLIDEAPHAESSQLQRRVLDALAHVGALQKDATTTRAFAEVLALQAHHQPPEETPHYEAGASLWRGVAAMLDDKNDDAIESFEAIISREEPSPEYTALAWHHLSALALARHDIDTADSLLQKSRDALGAIARDNPSAYVQRAMLRNRAQDTLKLAALYDLKGNDGLSTRLINQALKGLLTQRDLHGEAQAYAQLTRALRRKLEQDPTPSPNEIARVRKYWDRLQTLMTAFDDPQGRATLVWEDAAIAALEDDHDAAEAGYQTAARYFEAEDNLMGVAMCLSHLAQVALDAGQAQSAMDYLGRFQTLASHLGNPVLESSALVQMGWASRLNGDTATAIGCFDAAITILGTGGPTRDRIAARIGRAEIAAEADDLTRAVELLKEATAEGDTTTDPRTLAALERLNDLLRDSPSLLARAARKLAVGLKPA